MKIEERIAITRALEPYLPKLKNIILRKTNLLGITNCKVR